MTITIIMEETRRIERKFEVPDDACRALGHDAPEDIPAVNAVLAPMYGEIIDAHDADTEYNYQIETVKNRVLVPFD